MKNLSDTEIFAEISRDFESSDYSTRYDDLPEMPIDNMADEEIFAEINRDFESSDCLMRHDCLSDMPELFDTEEPTELDTGKMCVDGDTRYYFQAKTAYTVTMA